MDIYRRLLKVHNPNNDGDEIVHNAKIESKHYGITEHCFQSDIRSLREYLYEISLRDYEEKKKNHDEFYVTRQVIVFHKRVDAYVLDWITISHEEMEELITLHKVKMLRQEFRQMSKHNAEAYK